MQDQWEHSKCNYNWQGACDHRVPAWATPAGCLQEHVMVDTLQSCSSPQALNLTIWYLTASSIEGYWLHNSNCCKLTVHSLKPVRICTETVHNRLWSLVKGTATQWIIFPYLSPPRLFILHARNHQENITTLKTSAHRTKPWVGGGFVTGSLAGSTEGTWSWPRGLLFRYLPLVDSAAELKAIAAFSAGYGGGGV